MDEQPDRVERAERTPVIRPAGSPPAQDRQSPFTHPSAEEKTTNSGTATGWRRLARTPRGAVGLGIVVAALLLWPFSGWSWIPWLAGLAAAVLLRLLRLDNVLRGWDWHLAGLVVVGGLVMSTGPWAWALAASIGVLLAGLVQLPRWKLAAAGGVLCLLSTGGFVVDSSVEKSRLEAEKTETRLVVQGQFGAPRSNSMLPILLTAIARADVDGVCENLLTESAALAFADSLGQPDCRSAVHVLSQRITDPYEYPRASAKQVPIADGGMMIDACNMSWSREPAGPQLGTLTVARTVGPTYFVTEFRPC